MSRRDGLVRDRDGELIPAPASEPRRHRCERGFIPMPDGLAPCPVCRPKTVELLKAQRARAAARRRWGMSTPPPRP